MATPPPPSPPGHDPLPDADRTIVRPRPGGRGASAADPLRDAPADAQASFEPLGPPAELPELRGADNPILEHAYRLLAIVPHIRNLPSHPNPSGLKEQLTQGIREFEARIRKAGVANEKVIAARYIVCTFLDETAASTPWGSVGVWARDTLLVRFHNETWGGEKVFVLLSRLAESPGPNLDLLELIYVCIALGFEGRYRIIDNGRSQLETVRTRLYEIIRKHRPETDRRLSAHWQPAVLLKRSWLDGAPFWATAALALLAVMGAYALYSYLIGNRSDPVFAAITNLKLAAARPVVAAPPPAAKPKFTGLLDAEVAAGLVTLSESAGRSVISLKGDGFFESGSAQLPDRALPILDKIGRALGKTPGPILVAGHTDNQPIRTVRFPSNWHLSQERAKTVQAYLARHVEPSRMRSEGRAESEPVASNDTPADRARNRRVDITLYPQD